MCLFETLTQPVTQSEFEKWNESGIEDDRNDNMEYL